MPINKGRRSARRASRVAGHQKRIPTQPDGMPQGKHKHKGTVPCLCGGCNPAAKANHGKAIVL